MNDKLEDLCALGVSISSGNHDSNTGGYYGDFGQPQWLDISGSHAGYINTFNNKNYNLNMIQSKDKTKKTFIIDVNGFSKDELDVQERGDTLFITGSKTVKDAHTNEEVEFYVNRAIDLKGSDFNVEDEWDVDEITYRNGTLIVRLSLSGGVEHEIIEHEIKEV